MVSVGAATKHVLMADGLLAVRSPVANVIVVGV